MSIRAGIINECGAVGEMGIGGEKTSSYVTLCTTHIPYDMTWNRTGVAEVGSRRLNALAMALPRLILGPTHPPI
jgi:hypothetical protein